MNKKIFELGVQSGLLVVDEKERDYGYELSEFADIDAVVEYASLIIEECMDTVIENNHIFDVSEKGKAVRSARRRIYHRFYGEPSGK